MGKYLVISTLTVISLLLSSTTGIAANNTSPSDISNHWAQSSISSAISSGYVDGYPDGTFKPEQNVTRAEFIKMIDISLKLPLPTSPSTGAWYTPYINAAVTKGLHKPSDFTNDDWNQPITRFEVARIASRAVQADPKVTETHSSDREYVYSAVVQGLIQGIANGDLDLDGTTTRAQAITIIERVLTVSKQGKLEVDKRALQTAEYALDNTNAFAMFGMKTIKFPITVPLRSDVNATIKGLVVIDGDDQESPFRYLLDGMEREDGGRSVAGEYIFAFDTDLTFNDSLQSSMLVYDYFYMLKSVYLVSKSSAYAIPPRTPAGTVMNNYALFAIKKDRIDKMVAENALVAKLIINGKGTDYILNN